ncbi:MAG: response regulator [Deltaproteobacteria bacterium]|nr:response regulator [Nannocystaceae bacterium]
MIRSRVILLVEDNPDHVELTRRAFAKQRLASAIVVAVDGETALDYLFRTGSYAGQTTVLPDLVLLDLQLPTLDGLGVLRRIRADGRTRRLPVVVLTSSDEPRDIDDSYDSGANSFVRKPISFTEFAKTAENLCSYWLVHNEPSS